MALVTAGEVTRLSMDILRDSGAPEDHARIVTEHLVDANLAGHDSHGVMRLPQYAEEARRGQISSDATETVVRDWSCGSVVDARGAFGQVACYRAMERALDKAMAEAAAAERASARARVETAAAATASKLRRLDGLAWWSTTRAVPDSGWLPMAVVSDASRPIRSVSARLPVATFPSCST